nr:hypothetical protein Iba_chr13cCG14830 [Ipomoea batatas]
MLETDSADSAEEEADCTWSREEVCARSPSDEALSCKITGLTGTTELLWDSTSRLAGVNGIEVEVCIAGKLIGIKIGVVLEETAGNWWSFVMSDCQLSASYVVLLGMDGNKFFHKVVKDGIGMLSNLMRGWGGGRRNTPMVGQKRIAPEITVKHNQWVALGRERGSNEKGNYYLQPGEKQELESFVIRIINRLRVTTLWGLLCVIIKGIYF